ncbi:hypothetical protein MBLNU459_g3446t1 [Dothideomycetes sp. NU459]
MDRHSQPPSQRVQDRPADHVSSQQPPSSAFPPFHPPTAQPPVQMPFSDPFQNRDPFMPSSQHSRRGSYGVLGPASGPGSGSSAGTGTGTGPLPAYGERAWSAQPSAHQLLGQQPKPPPPSQQQQQQQQQPPPPPPPPPPPQPQNHRQPGPAPPPPSALNTSASMSYPYDSARRRSIGGAASPPRYASGPLEPPPPPPSFAARNMPPPSPTSAPPGAPSFSIPAPRHSQAPSPYTGARDLPSFGARPGASMSISSLIGGGESNRPGNQSPRTSATAPSPPIKPIHPPSPQRARSASIRTEQAQYPRPQSPPSMMHSARPHETRPGQTYAQGRASTEYLPPALSQAHQPLHAPGNVQGFRHFQSSPPSAQNDENTSYGFQPPARPNSQPVHPDAEFQQRRDAKDRGHFGAFRPFAEQQSGRMGHTSRSPSRPGTGDRVERLPEPAANGHHHPPNQSRAVPSPRMSQTARSTPAPASQAYSRGNYGTPLREDYTGLFRPAYHPYPGAPPGHGLNGAREDVDPRESRNDYLGRSEPRHSPPPSEAWQYDSRQRPPGNQFPSLGVHPYDGPNNEQLPPHREGEDGHAQRSFLGVSPDMARKNGRNSPLPQAVQGAQPRRVGPGGDPSIKSEFGRMFSGLGSGIGSNTPTAGMSANGAATPSRMSPARQLDMSEGASHPGAENESLQNGKSGSRGAKKGRRVRDEVARADSDSADGRNTPTLSQRGNKRPKTTHPAHHHHHHPHTHHHHHHHHNIADDQVPTPFNTLRFPPNPAVPQPAAHHHHHHHAVHAHAAHHHHHTPKSAPLPRTPTTSVSNQALLASVSDSPRRHLGSQLYATKLGLPPRESTPLDAKFHFKSTMEPIPRFESKENCTFTVRVPRAYLRSSDASSSESGNVVAGGLEEICRTRSLWGTEVYTDDSDVVAAAVHSGWLLGDFGEYTEDIHGLFNERQEELAPQTPPLLGKALTQKPEAPVRALSNADLHITLLVLPPLTSYTSSTKNHLRSREWGTDHDGMSYMIHSIEFVHESHANRLCERTGAAKHERIREELKRQREAAEGLLGLLQGGPSVSVGA